MNKIKNRGPDSQQLILAIQMLQTMFVSWGKQERNKTQTSISATMANYNVLGVQTSRRAP
jgi:hypothetical protein